MFPALWSEHLCRNIQAANNSHLSTRCNQRTLISCCRDHCRDMHSAGPHAEQPPWTPAARAPSTPPARRRPGSRRARARCPAWRPLCPRSPPPAGPARRAPRPRARPGAPACRAPARPATGTAGAARAPGGGGWQVRCRGMSETWGNVASWTARSLHDRLSPPGRRAGVHGACTARAMYRRPAPTQQTSQQAAGPVPAVFGPNQALMQTTTKDSHISCTRMLA
jgi:hypothetical protein